MRTALRFCFVGIIVGGNYVWCLVIVFTRESIFVGKEGSHYVILLY